MATLLRVAMVVLYVLAAVPLVVGAFPIALAMAALGWLCGKASEAVDGE